MLLLVYTAADDHEQAFDWLNAAFRERDNQMAWLKVDPRLAPLRGDSRFVDLLARMKLD